MGATGKKQISSKLVFEKSGQAHLLSYTAKALVLLASMARLDDMTDFLLFRFVPVREYCPSARLFASLQALVP